MNARIATFLDTLASQMTVFNDQPDLRSRISSSEVESVIQVSCLSANDLSNVLPAIAQILPTLERLATMASDFVALVNEAHAILDWAGLSKRSAEAPLIEKLCALNSFFENATEDFTAIEIQRNGDVKYGLGLSLHDGSLASYLSQMPSQCGMSNDEFFDHFFGDRRAPIREAIEEGQTALARFFEERFILRYDPILCKKALQLPEDVESGLRLLALHPEARHQQRQRVVGRRFETTRNDAIRIGMTSLRGFALMFDAAPVKPNLDTPSLTGVSDTDKCLTLADAILSKMHGRLATHWQSRFENIVQGEGEFEGKRYDEADFLGQNADKRPWQETSFNEDAAHTPQPDTLPGELTVNANNIVVVGDRQIGPLDPMTPEQRQTFVECLKTLSQPHLAQAIEMPEGWTILHQNMPIFLSERENERICAQLFKDSPHPLETWVRRLTAQIRGDLLLDDVSARALPLGSVEGQPLRRRWFKTALSRIARDPHALPLKAIVHASQHAVDLFDNYDDHVLRLENDDFRAIRQQPHRRLTDYVAPPVVQMQTLTALWIADFLGIDAEIPVPPVTRMNMNATMSNEDETLYRLPMGTPVYPVARGTVILCGNLPQLGNTILIQHPGQFYSRLTHLATLAVTPGQTINADTMLARSGMTLSGPALGLALDESAEPIQNWNDFGHAPLDIAKTLHTFRSRHVMPEMIIQ